VIWGQVRPGAGAQRYVIQTRPSGAWSALGGVRLTTPGGSLTVAVTASRGAQLRLWYPARRLAGPVIVVR
jgi:hypothetical protein